MQNLTAKLAVCKKCLSYSASGLYIHTHEIGKFVHHMENKHCIQYRLSQVHHVTIRDI